MKNLIYIVGALSAILLLGHTHANTENIDPNTLPKDPNIVNGDATISSSVNELAIDKKLLKVTDILGRKTKQKNQLLLYLYDDGSVEKKVILEKLEKYK